MVVIYKNMSCRRLTVQEYQELPPDAVGFNSENECRCYWYVFCVARTQLNNRIARGSNYQVFNYTSEPTFPFTVNVAGGARYWAVSIAAGGFSTESEAVTWVAQNGNNGDGSIECIESGTSF
jgi:hypothetical protein